jgi:hypothetical protein
MQQNICAASKRLSRCFKRGRAAREPRTGPYGINPIYALDLFEQSRAELLLKRHKEEPKDNNDDSLEYSNEITP